MKTIKTSTVCYSKNRLPSLAFFFMLLFYVNSSIAQAPLERIGGATISGLLYGQNAWFPNFVGGQLEQVFGAIGERDQSPFRLIRIGGTAFDEEPLELAQYLDLIGAIRNIGAEPIVQVSSQISAAEAANLVTEINNLVGPVEFWSIGNEPDLEALVKASTGGFFVDGTVINNGFDVRNYFLTRARAMKNASPSIKIFGPDYSFFIDNTDGTVINFNAAQPGGGTDPWSVWHATFLDPNSLDPNGENLWTARADVIDPITGVAPLLIDHYALHVYQDNDVGDVEDRLTELLFPALDAVNALRAPEDAITWSITETNRTTHNFQVPGGPMTPENIKTWNFDAGQWLTGIYGLGIQYGALNISPWSIHESGGFRDAPGGFIDETGFAGNLDLGFFDDEAGGFRPRSTYEHLRMLSDFTKERLAIVTNNNLLPSGINTFATRDQSGIAIIFTNSNATAYNIDVTIQAFSVDGVDFADFPISNATIPLEDATVAPRETKMLVFDAAGNLINRLTYNEGISNERGDFICVLTPPSATFYDFCDFTTGQFQTTLSVGSYTRSELIANGILDNEISGVQVPMGSRVRLFNGPNFENELANLTQDTDCSASLPFDNGNNRVSSIIISQIGEPLPPEVTFFDFCNLNGNSDFEVTLPAGEYTQEEMIATGLLNNDISRISIPDGSGLRVTLFEGNNFIGQSITLNEGTNICLEGLNFSNRTSSIIIEKTAKFFDFCDFTTGQFQERLPIGRYTKDELVTNGILDNEISGVQVAQGLEVTLFEGEVFNGAVLGTFTQDVDCSASFPFDNGSNRVSSVIISEVGQEAPLEVTFFDWPGFNTEGDFEVSLPIGEYTLADLQAAGINNNDITSMIIPQGLGVNFFDGNNFNGSLTFRNGSSDFSGTNIDQRVSSLRIFANGNASKNLVETPEELSQEDNKLSVYPNPTRSIITISGLKENETAAIINIQGQQLINTSESVIDVSSFSNGVYFVKVGAATVKFLKQ